MSFQLLPYGQSLALLTDFYQLTMAYGYWKAGTDRRESVFHLYFRKHPFKGGYTVSCGLACAIEVVENFRFDASDLSYLGSLTGNDGQPVFEPAFLDYLGAMRLEVDLHAMPEGTVAFPNEPLLRVQGPLIQCQLLETILLNVINFQTLIATKAARVCQAAGSQPVLEFGLRRAQGMDGGLAASRAAYVGGCAATSNVMAGKLYGIPVKGTHAHAWVMSFPDEAQAFRAYAEAMPNNCVFLVDTYNTLEGVRKAIAVGHELRARGHELIGVRLDSGDLAYLSIEARRLLDEGGFPKAQIVASNDLNETLIASLQQQGARIDSWGVGTQLVTAYDQPALGGVYKLSAIRDPGGPWEYKIKLSEQMAKVSTPGILQVRRYADARANHEDMIYDIGLGVPESPVIVDPSDPLRRKRVAADSTYRDLLVPIFEGGRRVYEPPSLEAIRAHVQDELARFHPGVRRFENPHEYPAGLEKQLFDFKMATALEAKGVPA